MSMEVQSFLLSLDVAVGPVFLRIDNSAAVSSAPTVVPTNWRNRHYSMFTQGLREEVLKGRLKWSWVPWGEMLADGLTKILKGEALNAFRASVGLAQLG
eukprot:4255658-Amphidinium_carterae.1